ncbi:hypothetical protein ACFCP7_12255, partial [Paenibacillus elgii]
KKYASYEHAIVINEFIGNHVEKSNHFSSLTVICTCNCPQILANDETQKIIFHEDKSSIAFDLMKNLLHNVGYSSPNENKFFVKLNI